MEKEQASATIQDRLIALGLDSKALVILSDRSQATIAIDADIWLKAAKLLREDTSLAFDYLSCITAVDYGSEKGTIDLVYTLFSFKTELLVHCVVTMSRAVGTQISTVADIWRSADWHEREIFDLYGIRFENHPDLRRILLPSDWEGHPMRKDYDQQAYYHGIKVAFESMQ